MPSVGSSIKTLGLQRENAAVLRHYKRGVRREIIRIKLKSIMNETNCTCPKLNVRDMEIALNAENIMKPRIKNHDAKEIMEMEMENQLETDIRELEIGKEIMYSEWYLPNGFLHRRRNKCGISTEQLQLQWCAQQPFQSRIGYTHAAPREAPKAF